MNNLMSRKDVVINLLFCLRCTSASIAVYHLKEGIFHLLGNYSENDADALLADYEKYGLLTLQSDDVYSGLYILASETKKIYDKNVHLHVGAVLLGFK
jgi:hypothetical protein